MEAGSNDSIDIQENQGGAQIPEMPAEPSETSIDDSIEFDTDSPHEEMDDVIIISDASKDGVTKKLSKTERAEREKERIQTAIEDASNEEIAEDWIPLIMENQTDIEREKGEASVTNGMGLNKLDSEFITSLHDQVCRGRRLSDSQVETAKKKLLKYWRQFSEKLPEGEIKKGMRVEPDTEVSRDAEIESIFKTEEAVSLRDIMRSISKSGKILKHRPISSGDISRYEFIIDEKKFTIDGSPLFDDHKKFGEYYKDKHGVVPFTEETPTKTHWDRFIQWVLKYAEDAGIEENNTYMAVMDFLAYVESNFTVTEDLSDFKNPDTCGNKIGKTTQESGKYAGEEFLILPSRVVEFIIAEEISTKISSAELANGLRALGYMCGKTRGKKINGKNVQCWFFNPAMFDIKTSDTTEEPYDTTEEPYDTTDVWWADL